ncbi:MAG TPA: hypothetical protein VMY77_03785 [Chitinophagaceae bacterium]|nr:hypothetical protein [Chitinophagaceae bacterium]
MAKGIYFNPNKNAFDTTQFIYADTLLVRVNEIQNARYYTFEYSNGGIVKRNHFLVNSTESAYTLFTYDAQGKLTAIEVFDDKNNKSRSYILSYSGDKLAKAIEKRHTSLGTVYVENEYTYTYTGDNISRSTIFSPVTSQTSVVDYTYDNQENHLSKRKNTLLVEPYFFTKEGTLYPYFFSRNNLLTVVFNGVPSGGIHKWVTNPSGYLTEILVDNKSTVKYEYNCN